MRKRSTACRIVLVTAPSMKVARKLVRSCLSSRLAACVNIVPGIESHYWWQGKLEKAAEVLLIIKTVARCIPELEQLILKKHPYDNPEFLSLPPDGGSAKYLQWLVAETGHRERKQDPRATR